jgi:hypothetical protein
MRRFIALALTLGLMATLGTPRVGAQTIGPEGTPQYEASTERMSYTEASTPQLLTHYWIVMSGVDSFPASPSPDQTKGSDLRKRILDLRLTMDFEAYAFQPGTFEAYRDALDAAYEQVGLYKDLFDIQTLDGFPINQTDQAERLAKMNVALAPFRYGGFRDDLKNYFYQRADAPLQLEFKNQPRLWQIAKFGPDTGLDSAGNAARLGATVLRNLRNDGMTVGDIFNEEQEAHFHDIRKAVRSVEVLSDMFPDLSASTADTRDGIDKVVSAYGKANDQFVAYHQAQASNRDLDRRANELRTAFESAQDTVNKWFNSGHLDAYAAAVFVGVSLLLG